MTRWGAIFCPLCLSRAHFEPSFDQIAMPTLERGKQSVLTEATLLSSISLSSDRPRDGTKSSIFA
jgi:hypothetical protein